MSGTMGCGPSPLDALDPLLSYLAGEYESYWAPHEAMFPTILVGDHFVARRLDAGDELPARGEIVVFLAGRVDGRKCPLDRCDSEPVVEVFFARLVGLPGDVVSVRDGHLTLNGESVASGGPTRRETTNAGREVLLESERISNRTYEVAIDPERTLRSFVPFTVEPGRYFVLGDYRSNSYDSRFFGTIPRRDAIAIVSFIYWSKAPGGAIRWSRLGRKPE